MNSYHLLTKQAGPSFGPGMHPTSSERAAMKPGAIPATALLGAGTAGLGGAVVGGVAGLGRAVFDDEDDGIRSLLRKVLGGAATGGLAGGTLGAVGGGGLAALQRASGNSKVEAMDSWRQLIRDRKLRLVDELENTDV